MPTAHKEANFGESSIDVPLTITEELTPGTTQTDYKELQAGTYNIPAGAYKVIVKNIGIEDITVNGETITPNLQWDKEYYENRATGKVDFCPAVNIIVPAGSRVRYWTEFPS